jgi:hypothetical protein
MCDGPLEYSQRSVEHGKCYAGAAIGSSRMIAGYGIRYLKTLAARWTGARAENVSHPVSYLDLARLLRLLKHPLADTVQRGLRICVDFKHTIFSIVHPRGSPHATLVCPALCRW